MTGLNEIGLGTDLVQIERFRDLPLNAPFYQRVFTESEMDYCSEFSDPAPHFASTFAAKEAVIKSLPSNLTVSLRNIEILRDEHGSPSVHLLQDTLFRTVVSMTHTESHAAAVAISFPLSGSLDTDQMRKLLNGTLSEIFPE